MLRPFEQGVLVLDSSLEVRFASGLAKDSLVRRQLIQRTLKIGSKGSAELMLLEGLGDALWALRSQSGSETVFVVHRSDRGDPLLEFLAAVPFAADILRHFITNPYEAMTVVDAQGLIRYISPIHEKFFNLRHGDAIGKPVREVIENTRLDSVLQSGRAEIGRTQEMKGTTRVVSRTPIQSLDGEVVGAIGQVMFKSPDALNALNAELNRLRQEVNLYRRELTASHLQSHGLSEIVGQSPVITKLKEQIAKVAALDVPVLIVGESGVGKDLVAHAIHMLSGRPRTSLVLINAAALPATLVESELFGYESGSFTGADRRGRKGKFEQANGGTLFLDEIGDMPLETQAKLLRVLQDGSFTRLGGDSLYRSDFRLIAASNRDFQDMLARGTFRLDLFYRISTVTLRVPALRERLEDLPLLVAAELEKFSKRHGVAPKRMSAAAVEYLKSLPWPGNVRQLQHVVARAAIFSESDVIDVADLEAQAGGFGASEGVVEIPVAFQFKGDAGDAQDAGSVKAAKTDVEDKMIREAMSRFRNNKKRVAEHLGISRSYLYKKLAEMK